VDHTFGLDEVRRFNVVQRAPVSVYADAHTTASLRRVYQHIFDRAANVNDSFVADVILWPMQAFEAFDLYGVRVTPIRLLHGRLPILGFRFDAAWARSGALPLAYCTDVSADALRHKHHPTHLTVNQAVGIAERVGAQNTYFTHIAHDLSHAETEGSLPEGMHLGYDGLTLA
jgi:phosphoribosyl 1,2-cyclic phosphate phosphodiesterase